MGGTVATILAAEKPPWRLVLVAPFYRIRYRWYYVLPLGLWNTLVSPFVEYIRYSERLVPVNRPEGVAEVIAYRTFPRSAADFVFELRRRATEEVQPENLKMPILLVYSLHDDVSSSRSILHLLRRIPDSQKVVVSYERSNHHIFHDYDRDDAVAQIVRFLGTLETEE